MLLIPRRLAFATLLAGAVSLSARDIVPAFACTTITQSGCGYNGAPSLDPCYATSHWFDGGRDEEVNGPFYPQENYANVTGYTPGPVFSASSAWVALENAGYNGGGYIAQVGEINWDGCTTRYSGSNGDCSEQKLDLLSGSLSQFGIYDSRC